MTDNRGPYRIYHMNRHIRTYNDRDEALAYVHAQPNPGDYEILDRSDT